MDPTNDEAERSLRPIVLWRKRIFGAQSLRGQKFVATISTICQTLKKQGAKLLPYLTSATRGVALPILQALRGERLRLERVGDCYLLHYNQRTVDYLLGIRHQ